MLVRDWLPPEALLGVLGRHALQGALRGWSKRWFEKSAPAVAELRQSHRALLGSGGGLFARGVRADALSAGSGRRRLAMLLLGLEDVPTESTAADIELFDEMVRSAIEDLVREFDAASAADGDGFLEADLADTQGQTLLTLRFPLSHIAGLAKASLPAPRKNSVPLTGRRQAIGGVRLPVPARIGSAKMTIAELRDLSPGDVVVLERSLDDGVELASPRTGQAIARAALVATDAGVVLKIQ